MCVCVYLTIISTQNSHFDRDKPGKNITKITNY